MRRLMKHNQLKPISGSPQRYGSPNKKVGFQDKEDKADNKKPAKRKNSKAAKNDWSL